MKNRIWVALITLTAPLVFAAPALAGNPPQNAYGGTGSNVVESVSTTQQGAASTLPFTGINVGAVLLVATVLLLAGLFLRRQVAGGRR